MNSTKRKAFYPFAQAKLKVLLHCLSFSKAGLFRPALQKTLALSVLMTLFLVCSNAWAQVYSASPLSVCSGEHQPYLVNADSHAPGHSEKHLPLFSDLSFLEEWEMSSAEKQIPLLLEDLPLNETSHNDLSHQTNVKLYQSPPLSFLDLNHVAISIFFQVFRL